LSEENHEYPNNIGINVSSPYSHYEATSHEDAITFMEFQTKVTDVEFSYKLTSDMDGNALRYSIGTLHSGNASIVKLNKGRNLIYDLHINPGPVSRQDCYGAYGKEGAFFEAINKQGYRVYEDLMPGDMQSSKPVHGYTQNSSFKLKIK